MAEPKPPTLEGNWEPIQGPDGTWSYPLPAISVGPDPTPPPPPGNSFGSGGPDAPAGSSISSDPAGKGTANTWQGSGDKGNPTTSSSSSSSSDEKKDDCNTCKGKKKKKASAAPAAAAAASAASSASAINPGWLGMAGGLALAAGVIAAFPAVAGVGLAAGATGLVLSMLGGASLLSTGAALGGKLFEQPGDAALDRTLSNLERVGLYTGVASAVGGIGTALVQGSERAAARVAAQRAMRSFEENAARTEALQGLQRVEGQVASQALGQGGQYTPFLLADGTRAVAYTGTASELRGALSAVEKVGQTQPGLLPKVYGQTTLPNGEAALVLEDFSGMTPLMNNGRQLEPAFQNVFTPKAYDQLFNSFEGFGRGIDKDYLFVDSTGAARVGIPRRAAEFSRIVNSGIFR